MAWIRLSISVGVSPAASYPSPRCLSSGLFSILTTPAAALCLLPLPYRWCIFDCSISVINLVLQVEEKGIDPLFCLSITDVR
ncbi:hypothetical protein Ddye_008970, partial [Dipteronia dyeriana]